MKEDTAITRALLLLKEEGTEPLKHKMKKLSKSKCLILRMLLLVAVTAILGMSFVFGMSSLRNVRQLQQERALSFSDDNIARSRQQQKLPTFLIVCGIGETDTVKEMIPMLKSMIMLARAPFRVLFITDNAGRDKLLSLLQSHLANKNTMFRHADIRVFTNGTQQMERDAIRTVRWINNHHSGVWSFIKMMAPWIAPEYDRLAVLDTDMVFVSDPMELWKQFDPPYQPQKYWLYSFTMPYPKGLYSDHGHASICSCIGLMEAAKIRQPNLVFPNGFLAARESDRKTLQENGEKLRPYSTSGDQYVYWLMFKLNETWLAPLDERWSRNKCQNYDLAFSKNKPTGILHQNCAWGKGAEPYKDDAYSYFDFFGNFPWHWLPRLAVSELDPPLNITVQPVTQLPIFPPEDY